MILTKEFLKQFEQLDQDTEHLQLKEKDYTLEGTLVSKDDTVTITITKKVNPERSSLDDFISKISEDDWAYVTDNFEEITGHPLSLINSLYEEGQYYKVAQLIKLIIQSKIDELEQLIS